jgi:beta-phosphoglucomutase-like phosphatase (HAD superfamily)
MIVLLYLLQIFFDDSVRNIASGKVAGFNTVIVRYTP